MAGKPRDAALPIVMASVEGKNGEFYGPTGFKEMKGKPGLVRPDKGTKNIEIGSKLWKSVESITGIKFNI